MQTLGSHRGGLLTRAELLKSSPLRPVRARIVARRHGGAVDLGALVGDGG